MVQRKFSFSQNAVWMSKCFSLTKLFIWRKRELLRLYNYDISDSCMNDEAEFVEYYWQWKEQYCDKNPWHCHFTRHPCHIKWPGIKPGSQRWYPGELHGHLESELCLREWKFGVKYLSWKWKWKSLIVSLRASIPKVQLMSNYCFA